MVDFVTALATATQALKLVSELREVDKAYDAAALKLKIADLTTALADIKGTLIEAKDEISQKQAEIERLSESLKHRAELIEYHGYRYDKGGKGRAIGHAYCPVCEATGHLVHLTKVLNMEQCPKCQGIHSAHVFGYE